MNRKVKFGWNYEQLRGSFLMKEEIQSNQEKSEILINRQNELKW